MTPTITTVVDLPADVMAMTDLEWMTALYASDMPAYRPAEHSPEQVAEWIAQGIERLGGELRVWQRTMEFRRALCLRDDAKRVAEWSRVFPKPRRQDRASDVASDLAHALRAAGVRRVFPTTEILAFVDEIGSPWYERVPVRDVEMHERLTTTKGDAR